MSSFDGEIARKSLAPKVSFSRRISGLSGKKTENKIIINVGGIRYETYKTTLKNIPDTRLSWLSSTKTNNPDFDAETGEFFFDRHPGVFNMILNYYRTGKLHVPTDVCGPLFEEELNFWGLDEKQIEPCCWPTYRAHRDAQETLAEMDGDDHNSEDESSQEFENIAEKFGIIEEHVAEKRSFWERFQPRIWRLLDEPKSSRAAKVFAFITLAFVVTSIFVFCMESHILFRVPFKPDLDLASLSVRDKELHSRPMFFLTIIEYICITFFTVEIILRLIFCPSFKDYCKQVFNWIDIFVVLPAYINIILLIVAPEIRHADGYRFLNGLRLIRIFRIFKLTIHVSGLKILGHTIKASAKELLLLILVLIIGVLIFACLIYYAEQVDENSINSFSNIPSGFWWAVVTMTTLGYGDLYPRTALGYIIGTICAVCGLLMLSLPVPIIVSNFTLYYSHAQARLKLPKKSKKTVLLNAANALVDQEDEQDDDRGETPESSIEGKEIGPGAGNVTGSRGSLDRNSSSDDSAIGSIYDKEKHKRRPKNQRKTSRVGISVIFTNEDNIHVGRRRDSLYPSPIHEITSSADSSPAPIKKVTPKYSLPQRKRASIHVPPAAARRDSIAIPQVHM